MDEAKQQVSGTGGRQPVAAGPVTGLRIRPGIGQGADAEREHTGNDAGARAPSISA